jgi:hypothetical protein
MTIKSTATMPLDKLRHALERKFPQDKVGEVFLHFNGLMKEARGDQWEWCIVEGGKFVEAVLKCFHYLRTNDVVDIVRVDEEIRQLEQSTSLSDFERMTIPRALRLIYEVRNKRGGAHNSSFNPIQMDCVLVVAIAKWVMEELTRLYLTDDAPMAQMIVESLLIREVPLIQEIDGDRLILIPDLSARVQLEIILWREHQQRWPIKDLAQWVHNHSIENIRTTLRAMKLKNLAHETEEGWKLTTAGMKEAEEEIMKIQNSAANGKTVGRSRAKGIRRGRK